MKKCPNCKKEFEKIDKNTYFCPECKEAYTEKDGKFTVIADKPGLIKSLKEKMIAAGGKLKAMAESFDVELDPDEEDNFPWC